MRLADGRARQAARIDSAVFSAPPPSADWHAGALRVVVFDFDRTLTLETRTSCINDYCSGWRAQIDPWRVLSDAPGAGWDSYGGRFAANGLEAEALREEFNRGKHTPAAYMSQVMENFVRESFNDGVRKPAAEPHEDFIEEELHDPGKRLFHLSNLLSQLRQGLDQQCPAGKMIVMTYNAWGAIFVLNALIHAGISQFFDAVHSSQNAVQKSEDGTWSLIRFREMPPIGGGEVSTGADELGDDEPFRRCSSLLVEGEDISHLQVYGGGTLPQGAGGKAAAIEAYYQAHGGVSAAVLVDDESENIGEWKSRGGKYWIDLGQAPGDQKLTIERISQAAVYFGVDSTALPSE